MVNGIMILVQMFPSKLPIISQPLVFSNNYSLLFDGTNDSVVIDSTTVIDNIFDGGGSVSIWYRYEGMGGSNNGRLISKDGATLNKGWQIFHNTGGKLLYAFKGSSGTTEATINFTHSIYDDVWRHMVIVYDTGDLESAQPTIYIDNAVKGVTGASLATDAYDTDASVDLYLGNMRSYDRSWLGGIDEVSFWDKKLDASEVSAIYNNRVPTDLSGESNLVGYWRLEEGTGTSIGDSSSNNSTGERNNAAWSTDVPS